MKDVVVYKCLFVWEVQLCFLQASLAVNPCCLSCSLRVAAVLLNIAQISSTRPELALLLWSCDDLPPQN